MATSKELKETYPNWLYIESPAGKVYNQMFDELGADYIEENRKRIFEKYIDKHFSTWDRFSDCVNGDRGFSPVVFCLYAEVNGIEPDFPIRIMRQILYIFLNKSTLK
jgi:hypothetical protein